MALSASTFIVMEFLQGETLEERLRKGPLDIPIWNRQDGAARRWCELRHPNGCRTPDVDCRRRRGRQGPAAPLVDGLPGVTGADDARWEPCS